MLCAGNIYNTSLPRSLDCAFGSARNDRVLFFTIQPYNCPKTCLYSYPKELIIMESIWHATSQMPHFPPLWGDINVDVLVIGGGMAGLLCAYSLEFVHPITGELISITTKMDIKYKH